MERLRALGLVVLGAVGGAAIVAWGSPASAQLASTEELNARFAVSKIEFAFPAPRGAVSFRFLKDKQTGDCYLAQVPGDRLLAEMIKTDDNACSGF